MMEVAMNPVSGGVGRSDIATPEVCDARSEDKEPICSTLAAAFAEGPVADWLLPVPASRTVIYYAYSRLLYGHAVALGQIHRAGNFRGAAIWYPHPNAAPPQETAAAGSSSAVQGSDHGDRTRDAEAA